MTEEKKQGITIICKICNNEQEYNLRNPNNIPDRPKTVCTQCGKWIYIDKEIIPEEQPKDRKDDLEYKVLKEFFNEFEELNDFLIEYLQKKYQSNYNISIKDRLISIENKLDFLFNQEKYHLLEKNLQRLLIKFPQIIEPNLKFIKEEYSLGNTLFRGDLLFEDSESRLLYIELKVIVPNYDDFETQLRRYLSHISEKDRLMYIVPDLTLEQKSFCNDNNIEFKIINLDEIFN